jgi:hypothetical protein
MQIPANKSENSVWKKDKRRKEGGYWVDPEKARRAHKRYNGSAKGRARYAKHEETRIRFSLSGLRWSASGIQPEHKDYFLGLVKARRAQQAAETRLEPTVADE